MTVIHVEPHQDRYLRIHHGGWNAEWLFQFPESITSIEGQLLECGVVGVEWQQNADRWRYAWQSDDAYIQRQLQFMRDNPNLDGKNHLAGLAIEAEVKVKAQSVELLLTLTNNTGRDLSHVVCEGGCLQARSEEFQTADELHRTATMRGGQITRLAELPHSVRDRSVHHANKHMASLPPWSAGEWFWGKGIEDIDAPCAIAMENGDGTRVIGICHARALSISANSDNAHHCIHSCPVFGDLEQGASVARRGRIVFGETLNGVLSDLKSSAEVSMQ